MWVYGTPNVPVMEIWYVVPCKACFVNYEYMAAKYGFYTTLSKEPLAKFLVSA
jgi:hypothetical protein